MSQATPWIVIPFTLYTAHLFNQVRRLDIEDGARCLALFKSNRISGLLLVATLFTGALI